MCGLNVIVDKRSILSPELISRMNKTTQHRGPDATAFFVHRNKESSYFFGHNRLKIIDLTNAANQPFFSPDNRFLLLYNGEVYNYPEIRRALQKNGTVFRTHSDTEVILQLLIQEGVSALKKLNGMFAIVFFDTHTNTLMLARDRFGQKPLYYAETADHFIISSEIKAIVATGLVKKELNESQLANYLTFKHACKPETFFQNIFELEEGTFATYTEKGLKLQPYLPAPKTKKDTVTAPENILSQTEELLQNSLTRQLQADVPVGLFLSGGIDSTLLLALLAQAGHYNFPSFSIANQASERSFGSDDFIFARQAAEQYNANHTVFDIDDSILKNFPRVIDSMDQPIADGAALLTDFLSEKTRKNVKVALSGAGADEIFGGYNRHQAFYQYIQNRSLLLLAKPILRTIAPILPTGFIHPWRRQFRLLRKMAVKIKTQPDRTFKLFTAMDADLYHSLKTKNLHFPTENAALPTKKNEWLRWALNRDQSQYLISDILALTDEHSMCHSLEVRTPFLDNELCTFISELQPQLIFRHGQKWILKELLSRQDGGAFIRRAKEGFGMPIGLWLRKPGNAWLLEPLRDRQHIIFNYLEFEAVQQILYKHLQGKHDFSVEIWALITLAFWLHKNFVA